MWPPTDLQIQRHFIAQFLKKSIGMNLNPSKQRFARSTSFVLEVLCCVQPVGEEGMHKQT